ncbi:MAG: alpha/beta hydrolase [Pseudorhodoplanes sp.]
MPLDIEAEYNNRARVPEHPQIFARWEKEAADWRTIAGARQGSALGQPYGPSERQYLDVFAPESGGGPLALFIHGGYWRALHPSFHSHFAKGLNGRGVTVAVAGYDLCPQVGVAQIIDQLRAACLFLWQRFGQRLTVAGHSAGGHLAGAMLATDWPALQAGAPVDLVRAAYSISGVFDLTPLIETSMNVDLKLDAAEARKVSPVFWPAPAGTLDSVVGGAESGEFIRQAKIVTEAWQGRTQVRYEIVPGANHFTVLEPLTDADSAMVARLVELCRKAGVK